MGYSRHHKWQDHPMFPLVWLALAAAITVGVITVAGAATVSVSWTNATQYTDGTPLGASELKGVRIEYGDCASSGVWGTKQGETLVSYPATSVQITMQGWGDKCVRGYTQTNATAQVPNAESVASNVAWKTVPIPKPNPPVFTVAVADVYEIRVHPLDGPKLARWVGTAEVGAACGDDIIVWGNGYNYHEVSPDLVEFQKAPRSAIVVAACQQV